jgi:hypothetical protein
MRGTRYTGRSLLTASLLAAASVQSGCSGQRVPATYYEEFTTRLSHERVLVYRSGDQAVQIIYSRYTPVEVDFGSIQAASTAELDPLDWGPSEHGTERASNADIASVRFNAIKDSGCLYVGARLVAETLSRGGDWRILRDRSRRCVFRVGADPGSGTFESIVRVDIPHDVEVMIP